MEALTWNMGTHRRWGHPAACAMSWASVTRQDRARCQPGWQPGMGRRAPGTPSGGAPRGSKRTPPRSLRNPPPVSWGSVAPERGQGTPGVTQTGSHVPPHTVAEPRAMGPLGLCGKPKLGADAAALVPFGRGAAARTPSFSALPPPKCLRVPPKLLASPKNGIHTLPGPLGASSSLGFNCCGPDT